MDKILLKIMTSDFELGLFEASEKLKLLPLFFVNSLGTVMIPRMSGIHNKKKEIGEANEILELSMIFIIGLVSPICFGLIGISKEFIPLIYGDGFEKCIEITILLMITCLFVSFSNVLITQITIPNKDEQAYTKSIAVGAIINLLINTILIPKYASVGLAMACLITETAICIEQIFIAKKTVSISKLLISVEPFVLSGIFMGLILFIMKNPFENVIIGLIFKILLGFILYVVFNALFLFTNNKKYIKIIVLIKSIIKDFNTNKINN